MSIRIWEAIANQKKQVENQREEILSAFKQRKVADELGQVRAEKLFQPITKLLRKPPIGQEKFPDYGIYDGQFLNFKNELPFGEGDFEEPPAKEPEEEDDPYADLEPFTEEEMQVPATESQAESSSEYDWDEMFPGPDKSSPTSSASPAASPVPGPSGEKAEPSPPRYSAATRDDKPPKYREPRGDDSKELGTLKRFLDQHQNNPDAIISTKKSKYYGMTSEEAKIRVFDIYTERAKLVLEKGDRKSVIGQKGLGPYEGKSNKEMREMIDKFEKGKKTGTGSIGAIINRLSLGISSIFAGNTSVKLREEIRSIAKLLHKQGIISSVQKNKVMALK